MKNKNSHSRNMEPKFKRFNDLKQEDINFDFHLHTIQTDGENTPGEMIAQAKKIGLKAIAFTEHVNNTTNWFDDFKQHICELRRNEKITVLAGIEAKALDFNGTIDASKKIIKNSEIIVGSIHRYPDGRGGLIPLNEITKLGEKKALETEFALSMGLLKNKAVSVIGHPFGIYSKFFNVFPEKHAEQLLAEASGRGTAIEINTKYKIDKNFFRLLSETNPLISVGSDAHKKSEIAQGFESIKGEIAK